jgi:ATP-dependent Clp protease ATP-binding subunit ClpC
MTSNIGAKDIKSFGAGSGMGFTAPEDSTGSYKAMKSTIEDALKRVFNPEFLNRIDDIIVFHPLEKQHIFKIIDITAGKLFKRLHDMGIEVQIDENAKEFLVDKGYDQKYGARPLKRALQKYVEDPLAEEMLKGRFIEGSTIRIALDTEKNELTFLDAPAPVIQDKHEEKLDKE